MKTANPNIRLLFYGLCLATAMYNCKTKDVDSLTPFTYTFKGIDNVTLPTVTPTAPAAVTVTAGSVTLPAQAVAVSAGLANMSVTGQVPAAVQEATGNISKVVSMDKATSVNEAFTPSVLAALTSTGKLPDNLKTDVAAIANNPALKAYLPVITLPTINGKPVGARLAAPVTVAVAHSIDDAGTDACKAAANTAFNSAKANLDAQVAPLKVPITAAYDVAVATANGEVAGCQAPIPAKYSAAIADAQSTLNATLATLDANKAILGDQYALLKVWSYVAFSQIITGYVTLQTAESNACGLTRDAKITSAATARDGDLNTINNNYNSALNKLTAARDQAVASCHNQGGRKSADGQ